MGRRRGSGSRGRRQQEKLLESGIGLLAIGVALLIAPLFFRIPVLHAAMAGLSSLGWILILIGAGIIGVHVIGNKKRGASTLEGAGRWKGSRGYAELTKAPSQPRPTSGPAVDHVVSAGYEATKRTATGSDAGDVMPPVTPTTWSSAVFDVIEWRRFEAVCEWLFGQAGFETKTQSHGADGGIDIWLYSKNFPDGPVSVVQCKHWSKRAVKVGEVRALLGSMTDKNVKRGIFATTSVFTQDATQFAKDNGIQLLDRQGLLELIGKRTPEQQRELLAVATKDQFWIPTCPSCGVKMKRRARKAGGGFWGCVNYPRCTTVING